ncbi:MAG TPA: urease accessory protein UreD [Acidimicrobiia bacterium]|nr:urease accessory protein UreD [Acidimicrobiia bacterium]
MDPNADAALSASPLTSGWTDCEIAVRLRRGANGSVRAEGVLCRAPVWLRWDGATLWLVGSGASPVGEDHIRVRVDVGPGVDVALRSVAATVVYAARGCGTRWETDIFVAADASVDWRPEPVILTERARHETITRVHAETGADVRFDEVLVLGRAGEPYGTLRSTLAVRVDSAEVFLTSIDTSLPGWSGPAGVGDASVIANRLRLHDSNVPVARAQRNAARLHPAPGCTLAVAATNDVADACAALDAVLPYTRDTACENH